MTINLNFLYFLYIDWMSYVQVSLNVIVVYCFVLLQEAVVQDVNSIRKAENELDPLTPQYDGTDIVKLYTTLNNLSQL